MHPIDHAWAILKAIPTRGRKPLPTGQTRLEEYSPYRPYISRPITQPYSERDAAHFRESLPDDFPLARHEEISHELDRMDAERNEQARSEAMMMAMQRLHEDRALDNASMFELGDAMRSRYASPLASGAKRGKEHYIERISSTDPDAPANTLTPQAGSPQDYIDSGYLQRVGHRGLAEGGADMHDFDISPPSTR
jgi:hypothetical protein